MTDKNQIVAADVSDCSTDNVGIVIEGCRTVVDR